MKKTIVSLLTILCLAILTGAAVSNDDFVPVDVMPEMIKSVAPEYPAGAKNAWIEAEVVVNAFIDETGKVTEAKVIECSKPDQGFEKAAIDAALKCTYKPASYEGKPVSIWVSYKVTFTLDDKRR